MSNHHIDIHHVAKLARLALSDAQATRYASQIERILDHMDTLAKLQLSGVEPTSHALPVYDVIRPDQALPGLTQQQALQNAPKSALAQFQIPKVIE
jgi:aspartyl-tRNA(Asn)/glutamyl-tRNA(Gln) amidotransferase subunit C